MHRHFPSLAFGKSRVFFSEIAILTHPQLHSLCNTYGRPTTGKSATLRERLEKHVLMSRKGAREENADNIAEFIPPIIKAALECPVCLQVMQACTIQSCENGHGLCQPCHPWLKDKKCPQCQWPIISVSLM